MKFCTVINCIDGRVQMPVLNWLSARFSVDVCDSITLPGPNLVLSEQKDEAEIASLLTKIKKSIDIHQSAGIAVAAHHDCAANPAPRDVQTAQIKESIEFLRPHCQNLELIGLWVDENWQVHEIA